MSSPEGYIDDLSALRKLDDSRAKREGDKVVLA